MQKFTSFHAVKTMPHSVVAITWGSHKGVGTPTRGVLGILPQPSKTAAAFGIPCP